MQNMSTFTTKRLTSMRKTLEKDLSYKKKDVTPADVTTFFEKLEEGASQGIIQQYFTLLGTGSKHTFLTVYAKS